MDMAQVGGAVLDGFIQRFQVLQEHRGSTEQLIQDILMYTKTVETTFITENQHLIGKLRDAELDLADATKSRREFQQLLQQSESSITQLIQENKFLKNHNPYVLVLIDGDGLLFDQDFIRQGVEGGKRAAYALRTAVLNQCGEHAAGVEVIAKIYANLSGLSRAMRRDGSLENESDLKDFSLGFTQGKATFDFVDVGYGKERADNKIKETTKWHLGNPNCRQILLGISHDAGYAPFLDELFQNEPIKHSITVVEGFPTVRELVVTGVRILNLDDSLFRSDKLVDRSILSPSPPAANVGVIGSARVSSVATVTSVTSATSLTNGSSVAPIPIATPVTPATPATSVPSPAPAPATTASYARATANASPPPQITLPLQPRPVSTPTRPTPAKPAPWNPRPRGLDPPLQVSQTALDSIKKRKDSNKLCNNHYLRGPCSKGDACCFEHKYKPTKDEINAIAFLTRLNPCENGQECDVENCIYGHHCPSVQNGFCTHPYCKFQQEDHPPGTKFKGGRGH